MNKLFRTKKLVIKIKQPRDVKQITCWRKESEIFMSTIHFMYVKLSESRLASGSILSPGFALGEAKLIYQLVLKRFKTLFFLVKIDD